MNALLGSGANINVKDKQERKAMVCEVVQKLVKLSPIKVNDGIINQVQRQQTLFIAEMLEESRQNIGFEHSVSINTTAKNFRRVLKVNC